MHPEDYDSDERKESLGRQPGAEYDEEKYIRPYILKAYTGFRVVQFYSPWIEHCQLYQLRYIDLAIEINLCTPNDQSRITFHAISYSVYNWVCQQNNIKGYPTIVAFRGKSVELMKLIDRSADGPHPHCQN